VFSSRASPFERFLGYVHFPKKTGGKRMANAIGLGKKNVEKKEQIMEQD